MTTAEKLNLISVEDYLAGELVSTIKHEYLSFPSESPTATDAVRGLLEGTPNLGALTERGITDPTSLRNSIAERLAAKFGNAPCRSTMRAIVVEAS